MIEASLAKTFRSVARHIRSSDPQDDRQRTAARMGYRQAYSATFGRGSLGWSRVSLPGAPSTRAARLDHVRMEGFGSWPICKGVLADTRWQEATGTRVGELGPAVRCRSITHSERL